VTEIPDDAAQINPEWLTQALEKRHPGVRVAAVEVIARTEMTNSHARLNVLYDEPAGAPATFFCKMLPSSPKRRGLIAETGMGPREVRFYGDMAPDLKLRVPKTYVAEHDEQGEAFVLLIEDLVTTRCTIPDGRVGLTPEATAGALEDLADLHAKFSSANVRAERAAWVPPPMESDYGAVMLQYGLDNHRDRLSDCFAEHAALYIEHRPALHALWQQGPQTVIHGDTHIGNLFDDHGRTGFLDWGIINVSTPMRDVGYLLVMAMGIEDRRAHERDLLRHYVDALKAMGGPVISPEQAWTSHRLHAAYSVPACCQIVMFPDGATGARNVFAEAFLKRAEAALEDLEVHDALGKAGIV
jgi:hypothetical protein